MNIFKLMLMINNMYLNLIKIKNKFKRHYYLKNQTSFGMNAAFIFGYVLAIKLYVILVVIGIEPHIMGVDVYNDIIINTNQFLKYSLIVIVVVWILKILYQEKIINFANKYINKFLDYVEINKQ